MVFDETLPVANIKITVGIPDDYFREQTKPTTRVFTTYLIIIIAAGLILVLVLSVYTYMPVYKLVKLSRKDYSVKHGCDEFGILREAAEVLSRLDVKPLVVSRLGGVLAVMLRETERSEFEALYSKIADYVRQSLKTGVSAVVSKPFRGLENTHAAYTLVKAALADSGEGLTYLTDAKKPESAKPATYKDRMMEYIDESCFDPNMYAGMVAERFGVSTKQVCRVVSNNAYKNDRKAKPAA